MSYVAIDDTFAFHRKMRQVSGDAIRVWLFGMIYAQKYKTDGWIPVGDVPHLGAPTPTPELVSELVAKVCWHLDGEFYRIHDYLDWNDSVAIRTQRNKSGATRQARFKARLSSGPPTQIVKPARVDPATETGAAVTVVAASRPVADPPAPPSSVPPALPRPAPRGNGTLITSPLVYERLKASVGYLGVRFRVPKTFHQELVGRYGGDEGTAEAALAKWYRGLEDAMGPDESIPDIYKFINGHFAVLVQARSAALPAVPTARKKDDQRQSAMDPAWRKQFDDATARKQAGETK